MACVNIPDFDPLPDISPITLTPPALPPVDLTFDYCCRVNLFSFAGYAPVGPLILAVPGASVIVAAVNTAIGAINDYKNALPLECPRQ